jgi:hypothetical protein
MVLLQQYTVPVISCVVAPCIFGFLSAPKKMGLDHYHGCGVAQAVECGTVQYRG